MHYYDNKKVIEDIKLQNKEKIFVCIGTDKHVWDSLGPMVGSFLKLKGINNVYGCLNAPITALNANEMHKMIKSRHPESSLIAIDIAISDDKEENNCICVKKGALKPGLGVGRELNKIGDYSILYFVYKDKINESRIRNPYNGALEVLEIIKEII